MKMAKIIYRTLLVCTILFGVFSLGSLIKIENPGALLGLDIAVMLILTAGYLLGKKSIQPKNTKAPKSKDENGK